MVSTPPFEGDSLGSSPGRATNRRKPLNYVLYCSRERIPRREL